MNKVFKSQVAKTTPYDNNVSGLLSTDVNSAIDELTNTLAISASPGFTWGRSGNCTANTWLLNDSVPSNTSGRRNFLTSASIKKIFVSVELAATFNIGVYEHTGAGTEVLLHTANVVASRSADFTVNIPITTGKELAIRVLTSPCRNPQIGLIIKGSL